MKTFKIISSILFFTLASLSFANQGQSMAGSSEFHSTNKAACQIEHNGVLSDTSEVPPADFFAVAGGLMAASILPVALIPPLAAVAGFFVLLAPILGVIGIIRTRGGKRWGKGLAWFAAIFGFVLWIIGLLALLLLLLILAA